jgi:hypothetical protein
MSDEIDRTVLPIRPPPYECTRGFADGIHFRYQGGQVRSLLPLLSYLQEHHLEEARKFADGLANRLLVSTGGPR